MSGAAPDRISAATTTNEDSSRWRRLDVDAARQLAARLDAESSVPSLRRRRDASRRLPALGCGHRDPFGCLDNDWPFVVTGCRFGLTDEQARAHANSLVSAGWSIEEIVETLGVEPKTVRR